MLSVQGNQRRSAWTISVFLLMWASWALLHTSTRTSTQAPTFNETLSDLLGLLPSEQYATQLLSPIDHSSGEARLRDLATRTRLFDQIFTSWQELHLPSHSGDGRDDRANVVTLVRERLRHNAGQLINEYDRMRSFFNRFTQHLFPWTMAYFADHSALYKSFKTAGRGIVMTTGNRQAAYAFTSITALRELGCDLPVEVFYLGNDDLDSSLRARLTGISGVTTRDLSQMIYDDTWTLKGYAAKPMAMLLSSFREALLLDTDVVFLSNPTALFAEPAYTQTGALFFRDRLMESRPRRDFLEKALPPPISAAIRQSNRYWLGTSGHMQESGVVVVDKLRHFVALLLTTRLNGPERNGGPGETGVYQMMHGDKETFWLGWEMAGDWAYAFYDGRAGTIGAFVNKTDTDTGNNDGDGDGGGGGEICGLQLLHLNHEGRPLWFNGWIAKNKYADDHLTDFQDFQGFMAEPAEESLGPHPWDGWKVREGNVMCMHDETFVELTEREQGVVGMTVRIARTWPG